MAIVVQFYLHATCLHMLQHSLGAPSEAPQDDLGDAVSMVQQVLFLANGTIFDNGSATTLNRREAFTAETPPEIVFYRKAKQKVSEDLSRLKAAEHEVSQIHIRLKEAAKEVQRCAEILTQTQDEHRATQTKLNTSKETLAGIQQSLKEAKDDFSAAQHDEQQAKGAFEESQSKSSSQSVDLMPQSTSMVNVEDTLAAARQTAQDRRQELRELQGLVYATKDKLQQHKHWRSRRKHTVESELHDLEAQVQNKSLEVDAAIFKLQQIESLLSSGLAEKEKKNREIKQVIRRAGMWVIRRFKAVRALEAQQEMLKKEVQELQENADTIEKAVFVKQKEADKAHSLELGLLRALRDAKRKVPLARAALTEAQAIRKAATKKVVQKAKMTKRALVHKHRSG